MDETQKIEEPIPRPEAVSNYDIIERLNALIQLDFDATIAYEQALEHVDDDEVRIDLTGFRADHERHINELSTVVEDLGGTPIDLGRDTKGLLLEGLTKLRSVTGTKGALKAMRMNERITNRSYDKAVDEIDLPVEARDVVVKNRDDERRHLAVIESHIHRLSGDEPTLFEEDEDEEDLDEERVDLTEGVRPHM